MSEGGREGGRERKEGVKEEKKKRRKEGANYASKILYHIYVKNVAHLQFAIYNILVEQNKMQVNSFRCFFAPYLPFDHF